MDKSCYFLTVEYYWEIKEYDIDIHNEMNDSKLSFRVIELASLYKEKKVKHNV